MIAQALVVRLLLGGPGERRRGGEGAISQCSDRKPVLLLVPGSLQDEPGVVGRADTEQLQIGERLNVKQRRRWLVLLPLGKIDWLPYGRQPRGEVGITAAGLLERGQPQLALIAPLDGAARQSPGVSAPMENSIAIHDEE